MPLEISLRVAKTVTVTTTPQQILPSRAGGDNRQYLSLEDKDAANTIMICTDLEYGAAGFSLATGGRPVYAKEEYWEQTGGVPSNAYYAWTLSGTALLNVQEG